MSLPIANYVRYGPLFKIDQRMVHELQAANDVQRREELQVMQTKLQKEYTAKMIEQKTAVIAYAETLLETQRQQILAQAENNHRQVLSSRIKELEEKHTAQMQLLKQLLKTQRSQNRLGKLQSMPSTISLAISSF